MKLKMVGKIIGFLLFVIFGFLLTYIWIYPLEITGKKMEATIEAKIEETMTLYKLQQNEDFKKIRASLHKELDKTESYKDQQNQDFHRNEGEDERISEAIKEKLQSVDQSIEKIQNQVDEIHEQMKTWKHDIVQGMDKRFTEVDGRLSLLFTELSDIYTYIGGFLLAALIGIVFNAYKLLISNNNIGHVHGSSLKGLIPNSAIIEKLKRKGLKNGMSIIYFDSSTKDFYHMVLMEVPVFKSLKMDDFCLIQSFNDLEDVEPHKLVFIFVEYNDRNIILEDENVEIGDLRNQVTKAFISFGCDVFVVYCKDNGSRDLPPNSLYNTRLKSIEKHPVLSMLSNKKRVMSINDRFNSNQADHLKENVK
uniref:Uncharacterized protein LOC111122713 n=1 Tax=Crassostrea virginica TaxID=6565 RepID=A0A8B8CYJ1_CRAVI|nr:uncharacterized protein LOC111122713 [Crassostrea virginica]